MREGRKPDQLMLLRVNEIAAWLQVDPSWVYAHADDLGAYRLGKYLRFSLERVLDRLEAGPIGGLIVNPPTPRPQLAPTTQSTPTTKETSDQRGTN